MKMPNEVANQPMARLQQQVVALLRSTGSTDGAAGAWRRMASDLRLWRKIETFGLDVPERQAQLTKVAFPDGNFGDVDAALAAGNKLHQLFDLARGVASVARVRSDYKTGNKGLVIVMHARSAGK